MMIEYLAMYIPAIAAVVGVIVTAAKTIRNMEAVCARTKREELYAKMRQIEEDDQKLKKMMCELIDNIHKINGYAEEKYDEEEIEK